MSALDTAPEIRSAEPASELRTYVIDGGRARLGSALAEVWDFRGVLLAFAQRAVKVKYAQAAIGIGWVVVQPLVTALILTIVFGRLAEVSSEGYPYLAFAMCGMVTWTFFASSVSAAMTSVVEDAVLLRKVYFPRLVLPAAAVLATTVDALPAVVVMIIVVVASGVEPSFAWLLIPVPLAVIGLSALAFGLAPAAMNVYYRDVRYVLPFVIQLGLFASPVVYSLTAISEPWRTIYAIVSPPAGAIQSMRDIVLRGELPPVEYLFGPLLSIAVAGWLGMKLFARMERGFADRI